MVYLDGHFGLQSFNRGTLGSFEHCTRIGCAGPSCMVALTKCESLKYKVDYLGFEVSKRGNARFTLKR